MDLNKRATTERPPEVSCPAPSARVTDLCQQAAQREAGQNQSQGIHPWLSGLHAPRLHLQGKERVCEVWPGKLRADAFESNLPS